MNADEVRSAAWEAVWEEGEERSWHRACSVCSYLDRVESFGPDDVLSARITKERAAHQRDKHTDPNADADEARDWQGEWQDDLNDYASEDRA